MAIRREPENTAAGLEGAADSMGMNANPQKLSTRQKELNSRWAYFQVQEHQGKGVDWEGRPVMSHSLRDAISRDGYLAPGYTTVGDSLPREFRRPVAEMGIVRNIVSRFTGLLFSNRKQPKIRVPGDEDTEDYLGAQLQAGQFWAAMIQARNFGGAMGSSCVGFKFIMGKVQFEALDPRWTTPEFMGKGSGELVKLTIQHTYSKEEWDREDKKWKTQWYWYRRVIDTETDTVWVPVKCRKDEPHWDLQVQKNTVRHNLGFVPYEWIQNVPEGEEVDGEPDCSGIYNLVKAIDSLLTEVYSGTIKNLDPTLVLVTEQELKDVAKGSDNAIKINTGSAQYLELAGSGPKIGLEVVKEFEDRAYRLAQCVPDQVLFQNSGEKTALEIERIYSSMLERADGLREQYGPAIMQICEKLLTAIRIYTAMRQTEDGRWVRGKVYVPAKVIQQPDGDTVEIPRTIGKGTICELKWPAYFRATASDVETYLRIAQTAKDADMLTKPTAVKYFAPFMDVDALLELHALKKQEESDLADQAEAAGGGGPNVPPPVGAEGEEGVPPEEEGAPAGGEAAPIEMNPQAWKTALDGGLVTINEYREKALGLGALPDGDLTMIQYRAKNAQLFVANAAINSPAIAAKAVEGDQPQDPGTPGSGGPPGQRPGRPNSAPGEKPASRSASPSPESGKDSASGGKPPAPPAASKRPESPPQKPSDPEEKSGSEEPESEEK